MLQNQHRTEIATILDRTAYDVYCGKLSSTTQD